MMPLLASLGVTPVLLAACLVLYTLSVVILCLLLLGPAVSVVSSSPSSPWSPSRSSCLLPVTALLVTLLPGLVVLLGWSELRVGSLLLLFALRHVGLSGGSGCSLWVLGVGFAVGLLLGGLVSGVWWCWISPWPSWCWHWLWGAGYSVCLVLGFGVMLVLCRAHCSFLLLAARCARGLVRWYRAFVPTLGLVTRSRWACAAVLVLGRSSPVVSWSR